MLSNASAENTKTSNKCIRKRTKQYRSLFSSHTRGVFCHDLHVPEFWSSICLFNCNVQYRQVLLNNPLMGSEWLSQPPTFSASLWETPTLQAAAKNTEIWSHYNELCLLNLPFSSPLCNSNTIMYCSPQ